MSFFASRLRQEIEQKKTDWLVILFLAGWPFVFFWPATLRQAVFFFGDIFRFFYPTHLVYANALREFRLPLWVPEMMAGFPIYAEGQIGALYPLHLFLYGLLPIDVATNYDILIHLAWVAVGMYLFARAIKLQPASAFLAAMSFGAGGFFYTRLQHMSVLAGASWLPWLMWAWEKHEQETDRRKRRRWFALLALFSGIQLLAGHPQFALLSALLLSMYAVVRWKRNENSPPKHNLFLEWMDLPRLLPVILFFSIGAALAAVQLLPTFELASFSSRAAGLEPKFFNAYSLRAIHFLMLFDPFLLGNPYPLVSVEVIGYIGFLPLMLALGAPFVRRDRRVAFFFWVAFVALFLGLGDQNIFYRGLRYLPLFNFFRVPSRFFFWFAFAFALLAAITFDALIARARVTTQFTRAQRFAMACFACLIAIAIGLVHILPLEAWLAAWGWLPWAFAFVTAWIVLGARRSLFTRTTLITLVLGLTVIDLALFASVYSKTYDAMTPVADFYRPPDSLAALKNLSPRDERILTSLWIYPVISTMRESLYPNISMIYGVPNAIGYTPLIFGRTDRYLEKMSAPMMNLLSARYYLIPQMLPVNPEIEGDDLKNDYVRDPLREFVKIPPTAATKIKISSSLAQSVALRDGQVVAQIFLITQDGEMLSVPLRAGLDTAEWAYERSDVRQAIQHSMPPIATTFPAISAFPKEAHLGHTFLAQFDLAREGKPPIITGVFISPVIPPGLIHIEQFTFATPEGREVSLAHLTGRDEQSLIYRTEFVAIYQNPDALPRAFLVHNAHIASDDAALMEMLRDDFKPLQTLVLADGAAIDAGSAQGADEYARIVQAQPERVVLNVLAAADAYVLLSDSWYPGWIARVDGVETPIQRADYIFRAVRVSPGAHQIEFEYRPGSLYLGAAMGLIALTIVVAIMFRR